MGMDQRRENILARDVAEKLNWKKPIAVPHHILLGSQGKKQRETKEETLIASKMSKSDSKSCIYMHDTYKELKEKLSNAYCPEGIVDGNFVLEYFKYIIFEYITKLKIKRPEKYGEI